jgi:hypothetical protein
VTDNIDLANDTIPSTYAGAMIDPPPPVTEKKPDLRTREGRAAAGLPPKQGVRGPGRPKGAGTRKPTRTVTDYRPGINGIGQMVAFGLSFTSPVDAAAVMGHTPNIAEALNTLAAVKPEVAAVLDKLMSAGPYGEILMAVVPLVVQILVNHQRIPAGMLGSVPPDDLLAGLHG